MRLLIFFILFNVSAFSQIVSFKADTLFMDGDIYLVDNIEYQINLYDSTIITPDFKRKVKVSYLIKDGIIYINDDIEFRINGERLDLVYKNAKKEDDLYYSGNFKLNY